MGPVVRREPIDVTGQKQEATPEMEAIARSATKLCNQLEWDAQSRTNLPVSIDRQTSNRKPSRGFLGALGAGLFNSGTPSQALHEAAAGVITHAIRRCFSSTFHGRFERNQTERANHSVV